MCISLFLNYQTIKGILHIHITFLKNIRQMFLFFTYQFVQIFITYNRTDVSLFKQVRSKVWKKICPNFYIQVTKLEESRSHYFPIYSWSFSLC